VIAMTRDDHDQNPLSIVSCAAIRNRSTSQTEETDRCSSWHIFEYRLCRRPWMTSSITPSATRRSSSTEGACALLCDVFWGFVGDAAAVNAVSPMVTSTMLRVALAAVRESVSRFSVGAFKPLRASLRMLPLPPTRAQARVWTLLPNLLARLLVRIRRALAELRSIFRRCDFLHVLFARQFSPRLLIGIRRPNE
jgi:hypothetical protein